MSGASRDIASGINGALRADYNGEAVTIADPSIDQWFNNAWGLEVRSRSIGLCILPCSDTTAEMKMPGRWTSSGWSSPVATVC